MSSLFSPARLSPQLRQPATTRAMMLDVMVALLPALGMAVFFFGPRALTLTGTAVVSCVLFEGLYRLLTRQSQTIGDLSACVTGMLLALSLPVSSPYWVAVLGSGFAIVVVKQFYGGMGRNFMNPALAGRMLAATLPTLMTTWPEPLRWLALSQEVDVVSTATPMAQLHEGLLPAQGLDQLFLGLRGGCMGEVSAFMLLLGGLYLFLRRVISLRVPGSYLGTVALLSLLLCPDGAEPLRWAACQLLGGGLLLGAFFFAVDPATTPVTPRGQTMFGVGCGLFTVLLRTCSSYPEGVGWAILTMNCMVWLLDRMGMPRRFGMGPFATTRAWALNLRVSMAQIKFVPPKLPRRPARKEGGAPGEGFLDLLRTEGKVLAPLGAVLAATCAVIYGVHTFTDLDTARAEAQEQRELLTQVMPAADFSSETPFRASGALSVTEGYTSEGELVGYCVEVQSSGFSGLITMIVGVDTNGEVTGVAVTSHSETTTVGGWAMTPEALGRYVGRSGTIRSTGPNALDAVSGATATSKAITAGVNRALAIVATLDTEQEINYEDIE
ncbi:RnfABCDGE type electron transport complex subunit D [Oscillospiraceae bacterium 50-16]|nr:RnfABCDGE type electron transport complex subunit D [Lawsonibacter sp.]